MRDQREMVGLHLDGLGDFERGCEQPSCVLGAIAPQRFGRERERAVADDGELEEPSLKRSKLGCARLAASGARARAVATRTRAAAPTAAELARRSMRRSSMSMSGSPRLSFTVKAEFGSVSLCGRAQRYRAGRRDLTSCRHSSPFCRPRCASWAIRSGRSRRRQRARRRRRSYCRRRRGRQQPWRSRLGGEQFAQARRVDGAGADRAHANAAVLEVGRPGPGERAHRSFRGVVDAVRGEPFAAADRCIENDRRSVRQVGKRLPHRKQDALHVGVEDRVIELLGDLAETCIASRPR